MNNDDESPIIDLPKDQYAINGSKPSKPKASYWNWYITDWYDVAAIPITVIGVVWLWKFMGW